MTRNLYSSPSLKLGGCRQNAFPKERSSDQMFNKHEVMFLEILISMRTMSLVAQVINYVASLSIRIFLHEWLMAHLVVGFSVEEHSVRIYENFPFSNTPLQCYEH